jgi:RNA recognition motif-containing protein
MTKLFVGGLPYSIDSQKLNDMFSQIGQVASANVINDKFTGQSKGFGFVEMIDDSAAEEAIKQLNGTSLEGRTLGVSVAKPREDNRSGGGGGRGFSGGRNNNSGFGGGDRRGGSGGGSGGRSDYRNYYDKGRK